MILAIFQVNKTTKYQRTTNEQSAISIGYYHIFLSWHLLCIHIFTLTDMVLKQN